ncbi:hypothetical protein [Streptomyces venetus]|uniref:hypothetical protein n=1 Tax=Streptomyces venetus TaxID=1701086 RepID=UPI003C2E15A8
MKKRVALLAASAVGVLVAATAPAQAATDDWHVIPSRTGDLVNHRATGWTLHAYDGPTSPDPVVQAEGWGRVDWGLGSSESTGYTVEVHAGAKDLARDNRCAVTVVNYDVKVNGSWHNGQERSPAVDCTDGNGAVTGKYYRSNYKMRNVRFKECLGGHDGSYDLTTCKNWSWPR